MLALSLRVQAKRRKLDSAQSAASRKLVLLLDEVDGVRVHPAAWAGLKRFAKKVADGDVEATHAVVSAGTFLLYEADPPAESTGDSKRAVGSGTGSGSGSGSSSGSSSSSSAAGRGERKATAKSKKRPREAPLSPGAAPEPLLVSPWNAENSVEVSAFSREQTLALLESVVTERRLPAIPDSIGQLIYSRCLGHAGLTLQLVDYVVAAAGRAGGLDTVVNYICGKTWVASLLQQPAIVQRVDGVIKALNAVRCSRCCSASCASSCCPTPPST